VEPQRDLLLEYAQYIRAHPRATGFVGLSRLPTPTTARQAGIHMAGVSYFWDIATKEPGASELPWGVTANLCIRRPPASAVSFGAGFPKSGGGEDIDYCLRLRAHVAATLPTSEGLVAAPRAVVTHPYWNEGRPHLSHFYGWAHGDGHLIDLHPRLTYRNLPNLAETLLVLLGAAGALAACAGLARVRLPAFVTEAQAGLKFHSVGGLRALLRRAGPACEAAAPLVVAAAAGCVLGDLARVGVEEVVVRPNATCAHLPLPTRLAGIVQVRDSWIHPTEKFRLTPVSCIT
jgi:hypothetical protein